MKRWKFSDNNDVICTASGGLEDQDQEFFFNGIQTLENHWTKFISVEGNYVEVTKYHVHILLLTVSGYELFERPSYVI